MNSFETTSANSMLKLFRLINLNIETAYEATKKGCGNTIFVESFIKIQ